LFFCLETKEPKIQGSNFFCYKLSVSAKRFELAALKQQIVLNASTNNLLNATKFKAFASLMRLSEATPSPSGRAGEGIKYFSCHSSMRTSLTILKFVLQSTKIQQSWTKEIL
jgi:hypothetical protein